MMIPETYEQWRYCITEECQIPLTKPFIAERLLVWRDTSMEETQRFRNLYGDKHWQSVIRWFEQAEKEMQTQES